LVGAGVAVGGTAVAVAGIAEGVGGTVGAALATLSALFAPMPPAHAASEKAAPLPTASKPSNRLLPRRRAVRFVGGEGCARVTVHLHLGQAADKP
jgi:hypothetical protein